MRYNEPLARLAGTVIETGTLKNLLAMLLDKLDSREEEDILRILEAVGEPLAVRVVGSIAVAMSMVGNK